MTDSRANKTQTLPATAPLPARLSHDEQRLRLGWRIVLTLLLLAGLVVLSMLLTPAFAKAAPAAPEANVGLPAQSLSDPLVLAFYYPWFDETTWTYEWLSDLPAERYASSDRATMGRHIEQAQRAGIDAFLVAWYGQGDGNPTEANLAALLEEASARNFRIGILFETNSPFMGASGGVSGALTHALATHATHPAFLRADGRPVFFFWRPYIYGVDAWRDVRAQVDPGYGSLWISEGVDTSFLSVFDGHHLYSNSWNPPADLTATNQKFANLVQQAREQHGAHKQWVATVMPGYDDVKIRPGAGFATDRAGGAYFERAWQAAIASQPNWIVINSFNEWPEGSYIEPSEAYGDLFLNISAVWSGQFKAGGGPVITAPPVPAPLPEPAPKPAPEPVEGEPVAAASQNQPDAAGTALGAEALPVEAAPPVEAPAAPVEIAEPEVATAFVDTPLLNLRAAPLLDAPVLAELPQGAAVPILAHSNGALDGDWWQVEANGQVGWVYGPLVRAAGPLEGVPFVSAENEPEEPLWMRPFDLIEPLTEVDVNL